MSLSWVATQPCTGRHDWHDNPMHRRRTLQSRGVHPLSAEPAVATCASLAFRHVGAYATLIPLTAAALRQPVSFHSW